MGFFDEVDSIVINNKEVQSIISSDGGIIYEKSSGYELTLTADKSIVQTGESATLSATLTNNNVPMAGETIFFYDSNNPPISYSTDGSHDFTVNVGDAFKLYYTSQSTASNSYCAIRDITNSISIYVHKEGNVSITETNISRTTTFNSFSYLKLENGILSNGDGDTCDLSSYTLDFDLVRINNSGTVYFDDSIIGSDVTDSNGVASVGYTGKGTGDLNIQAYDPERIISSEISVIEDCLFYDDASIDYSNVYGSPMSLRNNGYCSLTHNNNGYYIIQSTTVGESGIPIPTIEGITDDIIIEFEGYENVTTTPPDWVNSCTVGLIVYYDSNNWYSLKSDGHSHYKWIGHNVNGSYSESNIYDSNLSKQTWNNYKITIEGTTMTITVITSSNNIITWSQTIPLRTSSTKYILPITWRPSSQNYFKHLKVKAL